MPPALPSSFYGRISAPGVPIAVGDLVSARIDGVIYEQAPIRLYAGELVYTLDVPGDDDSTPEIEGGRSGQTITFYVRNLPATPTAIWQGGTNIQLDLTANAGVNHAPVISEGSSLPLTLAEDSAVTTVLHAADADGDPITWSVTAPAGHGDTTLTGSVSASSLVYTPDENFNGADSLTVQAADDRGGVAGIHIELTITPVNDAPQLTAPAEVSVSKPNLLAFQVSAADVDGPGDPIFTLLDGPHGASLDAHTGWFTWTVAADVPIGDYQAVIQVSDQGEPSMTDQKEVILRVIGEDPSPNPRRIFIPLVIR